MNKHLEHLFEFRTINFISCINKSRSFREAENLRQLMELVEAIKKGTSEIFWEHYIKRLNSYWRTSQRQDVDDSSGKISRDEQIAV